MLAALGGRARPRLTQRALLARLGGARGETRALRALLRELEQEGRVERLDGRLRLARSDGLIEGEYHLQRDRAWVVADDGARWRVERSAEAGPGDRVLVLPLDRSASRGEVVQVIGGARAEWIGRFESAQRGAQVTPYGADGPRRIRVAKDDTGGARDAEMVRVRARRRGRSHELWGRVGDRLGSIADPDVAAATLAWRHRLRVDFPGDVIAQAEAAAERAAPDPDRCVDLRDRSFVTIDPESARDHDDAVCVENLPQGRQRLWVAIADVSRFVPEGSAIDREALRRGNSIYFPDRAIPMLPEALSGNACSLRAGQDRAVLAVELEIDTEGRVAQSRFCEAVIRSRAALGYDAAAIAMDGGATSGDASVFQRELCALDDVTSRLRRRRQAQGCLELELPAPRILVDARGRAVGAEPEPRSRAHRAIEDAMLAANRVVAQRLLRAGLPALYRVHESPAPAALGSLRVLLETLGIELPASAEGIDAGALQKALEGVAGRPEESLAHELTLRAMRQAHYSAECLGHFALGFDAYLHFTSPIRRYADLVAHRCLRRLLAAGAKGQVETPQAERERAVQIAQRVSLRERVSMDAERDMLQLQQCLIAGTLRGEVRPGRVRSVAPHGVYVQLDSPLLDGLVPAAALGAGVRFDPARGAFVGRGRAGGLRVGQRLEVRVDSVEPMRGWITLSIARR